MRKLKYLAILEPSNDGGFSVYFPQFLGCISYGSSAEEAVDNAKEALELHIYGMEKDGEKLPPSDMVTNKNDIEGLTAFITIFPDMVADEMSNSSILKVVKKSSI